MTKCNWVNELEMMIYGVRKAFHNEDITADQCARICDTLWEAKEKVNNIIKEVDTLSEANRS